MFLQSFDLGLKLPELLDDAVQSQARQLRQAILRLMEGLGHRLHVVKTLARNDPELCKVPAQPVDQHRSLPHQQVTRPVQHQRGLLVHALGGHKAHGRPRDRFADCLGIGPASVWPRFTYGLT